MVTVTNAHGRFVCTPETLDRMIAEHLPNSVAGLRELAEERACLNYSDVHTVSELLIMLGDMEG